MVSCKTLLHHPILAQRRYIHKDSTEGPVCFQLAGSDPIEVGEAAKMVTDCGADLIDLNCGCPVPKIRRKGAGSSLLTAPQQLYQLIYALKQNTHLPVSIKIRVQGNSSEQFNHEIAKVVSDAGADFLVVHGRHWTEHYETPCNHEQIQFFVEQLKIPVIGNGDIACINSLKKMFATGCAGVMVARAGVGQPWLIKKLIAEMRAEQFDMPSNFEIGQVFIEHVAGLIELLQHEKFAILQSRKFAKYYARTLTNKLAFCSEVNNCETFDILKNICSQYFNLDSVVGSRFLTQHLASSRYVKI